MLRDLRHLSLQCKSELGGSDGQLESLPNPPPRLEVLDLLGWEFSRVPKWIGELRCLRILSLHVLHLSSDEVRVLGELPSLVSATIHVCDVSQDKVVIGTGLFLVLEDFEFRSDKDVTAHLRFEAGAMALLQKLVLEFDWNDWRGATPVGMEYLPCLRDIHVRLHYTSTEPSKNWRRVRGGVESAFKSAARVHPRHPSVTLE